MSRVEKARGERRIADKCARTLSAVRGEAEDPHGPEPFRTCAHTFSHPWRTRAISTGEKLQIALTQKTIKSPSANAEGPTLRFQPQAPLPPTSAFSFPEFHLSRVPQRCETGLKHIFKPGISTPRAETQAKTQRVWINSTSANAKFNI